MKIYPKITVAVAALNEEKYIAKCLDSLTGQTYPGEVEIIIADGGSTDKTREIAGEYAARGVRVIENPKKIQAAGRNLAFRLAETALVAYIDAHSYADKNWLFSLYTAYEHLKQHDSKTCGVGSVYFDAKRSGFTLASEAAFRSILSGAGKDVFQNKTRISKVDNAYACLYEKSALESAGWYDESLPVGEDMELNQRLTGKLGRTLYVNPQAIAFYFRRDDFIGTFRQQFRYGYWRLAVMKKLGTRSSKPLAPGFFVIFLAVALLLSAVNPAFLAVVSSVLVFYAVVVGAFSLFKALQLRINPLYFALVTATIHFGYGAGIIWGMLKR
jgi:succinoglycan biosynthesis protein ExoA